MISFLILMATVVCFSAILALALNFQWGLGGMVNFGLAGLYALGAYSCALLMLKGGANTLFATLGAKYPAAAWEDKVLLAFQSWAALGNINIGLVADSSAPLGQPGPLQGNPTFGDLRVAARPLSSDVVTPPSAATASGPGRFRRSFAILGDLKPRRKSALSPSCCAIEFIKLFRFLAGSMPNPAAGCAES